MGNSIIVKRIKGITQHYAKDHMCQYKKGDFLRIVPEFDNPYDHNALAIYDDSNHKLGFIDKNSNVEVYNAIKNVDYVCIITSVYFDYTKPSIEFEIIYRTAGTKFEISDKTFNEYLSRYNKSSVHELDTNTHEIIIPEVLENQNQRPIKKKKIILLNYSEYYDFLEELKKFNSKIIYLYHEKFGLGKVVFISKNYITVKFDSVGDKTFRYPESINTHLYKTDY